MIVSMPAGNIDEKRKRLEEIWKQRAANPHHFFSNAICEKFPNHPHRWYRAARNARWMINNHKQASSRFSNNQLAELIGVMNTGKP